MRRVLFSIALLLSSALAADNHPTRILSIDGGGVKGVINLYLLDKIEQALGKPASEIFDVFTGTSAGGITVVALNLKDENGKQRYTAGQLRDIFARGLQLVFVSDPNSWTATYGFTKYGRDKFEAAMSMTIGDELMKDVTKPMFVTAVSAQKYGPIVFNSLQPEFQACRLRDVALATGSMPGFFPPATATCGDTSYVGLMDGAALSNDPAWIPIDTYISKVNPNAVYEVYSFGTGYPQAARSKEIQSLIGPERFFRTSPVVNSASVVDAASDANLEYLMGIAKDMEQSDDFQRMLKQLKG